MTEPPMAASPDSESSVPPLEAVPYPDRLAEFQRRLAELTPRVYMTPVLVALNVLVFILMGVSGVSLVDPTTPDLLRWGADFGPKTTSGEWWRMLTCTFVHIGIIHILLNMWVLATAGPLVERMIGNVGFQLMYVVAGLTGSLASLFWNPLLVSAGASGAIFGVYGALLAVLLRNRGSVPAEGLAQLRGSGLGFMLYNLVYGMTQPNIDSAAHFGGLAGGFLCGLVLGQPFTPKARAGRPFRNLWVSGLGACLVMAGVIGIHVRHPDIAELGARVQHGNIEVFYTNDATRAEADRLGAYLVKNWPPHPDLRSGQLKKTSDGYQFRMVVRKEFQKDQRMLKQLEFDGARMSRDVFDGAAVEVHACDEYLKTLMAFPPRADMRYGVVEGMAEVFFAADVSKADAQRLATYLGNMLKGAPGPVTYKLAKRGGIIEVYMVVRPEALNDPAVIAGLRQDRNAIAVNVFRGAVVEMHLCDELMNEVRVLEP